MSYAACAEDLPFVFDVCSGESPFPGDSKRGVFAMSLSCAPETRHLKSCVLSSFAVAPVANLIGKTSTSLERTCRSYSH